MNPVNQPPHLTCVGLGPGDPDLITIKGLRAMQAAQLIFVPRSKNGEQSLALRIAKPWLDTNKQQIVELPLPMTRNADELIPAWQAAADQIAASFTHYTQNKTLTGSLKGVYLLLGDPLLYGTFTYIWGELATRHPDIQIDIVPGVTSFATAAAKGQMTLSTTSDRVAIIPASYDTDSQHLQKLLADFETVILLKVGPVFRETITTLDEMGLLEASLYAERVGMPEERIASGVELRTLKNERRPYLSLLVVRRDNLSA
ncbi:MAG: precorrin-2 C(20)-methyltransferase [Chloroflexota bacterium]